MEIPRLNKCFVCVKWTVEKAMYPVEVPSQGTEYVKKLICRSCMLPISIEMQDLAKEKKEG